MIKTVSRPQSQKSKNDAFTFVTPDYQVNIPRDRVLSDDEMILLTQMVDHAFLLKKIAQNKPTVVRFELDENTILGLFNVILAAIFLVGIMNLFSMAIRPSYSAQFRTHIVEAN